MTVHSEPPITVSRVALGSDVERLVVEVLRSGRLAQGVMVEQFEALCARMSGAPFAVAVSNGTAALESALEAMGVGPGDEVVTTPFTFAATVNAIVRAGATVRFADIASDYTIDPGSVASLVNGRTAAVVPVHLYGLMADMPALQQVAQRHGLRVVEDAAQAHGARVDGRPAGSFGCGTFSFYGTKNVTAGEGGVVTTSDLGLAHRLRLLRNQGMSGRYHYEMVGGRNLRMTDLQAAVAIPQLLDLEGINARRARNAAILTGLLAAELGDGTAEERGLALPVVPDGRDHVWHQYTVLLPRGTHRDAVLERMRAAGVTPEVYYPWLVPDYPAYADHPLVTATDETPVAADVAARCLSLPVRPSLTEEELQRVARATADAVRAEAPAAPTAPATAAVPPPRRPQHTGGHRR